jgi:DNA-binding transcriptional MerR regulator
MAPTITNLRISEVAERTGFSGPTLRYYEQIGLLPAPERTGTGYRMYRERDVVRLDFIARAKRLGCSLDEIKGLVAAWDADRCAPVQHQLRSLVGSKLGETRDRIAELTAFEAELKGTAAQLAAEPVEGACGDGCACVTDAEPRHVPTTVAIAPRRHPVPSTPIACSLAPGDLAQRLDDWQRITDLVVHRERIDGGVRLLFLAPAPVEEMARLAAAEQGCCPFFAFALTVDARGTALEVTAPPDGADVLAETFGSPS